MGYLKPDSIPAAQEVHMREACQIITSRCRGAHIDNSPCLKAGDSWFIQQPLRRLSLTRCPTGVIDSDVPHPI